MDLQVANLLLYSDEAILAADKPPGLPTLPDGYHPQAPCLVAILKSIFDPLWVVHRLDKFTSGVIVFARTAHAHRNLNAQFAKSPDEPNRPVKVYHSLVVGAPPWRENTVTLPLRPDGDRRHRSVVDSHLGKPSITEFRLLEQFAGFALVEAIPRTGRTHQVRAHLSASGFPIAGDDLYGGRAALASRLMLHALSLTMFHPLTGQEMAFQAPYPQDFLDALGALRR